MAAFDFDAERSVFFRSDPDSAAAHFRGAPVPTIAGALHAATNAPVKADGETVGMVTYSDRGYSLGVTLATAHLRMPFERIGTKLSIDINGVPTPATVSPMPFFDPEGARLRA